MGLGIVPNLRASRFRTSSSVSGLQRGALIWLWIFVFQLELSIPFRFGDMTVESRPCFWKIEFFHDGKLYKGPLPPAKKFALQSGRLKYVPRNNTRP